MSSLVYQRVLPPRSPVFAGAPPPLLGGGDDYELLFTAPAARRADVDAISASLGLALHRIGTLTPEPATLWLRQRDGRLVPGTRSGYDHFG